MISVLKNSAVLLRQQLKGQRHMGRNISVVKDVFVSCVLVSHKVSSAVGKQHRQRRAKGVPCFLFAERATEREAFHVTGAGQGCLEERCCGMQPPVCNFKTSSAAIFRDLISHTSDRRCVPSVAGHSGC